MRGGSASGSQNFRDMQGPDSGPLAMERALNVHETRVIGSAACFRLGVEYAPDFAGKHGGRSLGVFDCESSSESATLFLMGEFNQLNASNLLKKPQRSVAHAQRTKRVAGRMIGNPMREIRAYIFDAQPVDQQLGKLEDARKNSGDAAFQFWVGRHTGGFQVVITDHGDARSRGAADNVVAFEYVDEFSDQRNGFALITGVVVHLPAAGLFRPEVNGMAEPFQHLYYGDAGGGKQQVVITSDEKRNAHSEEKLDRERRGRSSRKPINVIIAQRLGKPPDSQKNRPICNRKTGRRTIQKAMWKRAGAWFAAMLYLSIAGAANGQGNPPTSTMIPGVLRPGMLSPDVAPHDSAIQSRNDAAHAPQGELHPQFYAPLTVAEKWKNFSVQTVSPLTAAGTVFGGALAHVTAADPKFGSDRIAFAQRVGASGAMIASQSFFGSFLLASMLHQDPRYFRQGPRYGGWTRVQYALSRAWLTRNDAGGNSINWSNIGGTAMATSLALSYYPAASRNGGALATQFTGNTLGVGISDLAIEFLPDLRQRFVRHRRTMINCLEPWRLLGTK